MNEPDKLTRLERKLDYIADIIFGLVAVVAGIVAGYFARSSWQGAAFIGIWIVCLVALRIGYNRISNRS